MVYFKAFINKTVLHYIIRLTPIDQRFLEAASNIHVVNQKENGEGKLS